MKKFHIAVFIGIILFFISCAETIETKEEQKKEKPINYYETGREIASISQATLMKNVKAALEKGGPIFAIEYCSLNAMPISDSLSKIFNCNIKRLALKNRNPTNYPNSVEEKKLLYNYLERSFDNKKLNDTLLALNSELIYYQPIYLSMETCLKCHGKIGRDISNETASVLYKYYPDDKAIDYKLGEFRGVWRIRFALN